jgi:hypothetical protein
MKKVVSCVLVLLSLTGCACNANITKDTPTKKVEQFFNNYQTLNDDVLTQLDEVINKETTFTDAQREIYRDIMKKHYQDLKYEIKDEIIDGDNATVTVEIEVKDYSKTMTESDEYLNAHPKEFNDTNGVYDVTLFNDYRLEKLKEVTDTVTYTLDLTLTKVDDEWRLDDISDVDESKIHGTYNY